MVVSTTSNEPTSTCAMVRSEEMKGVLCNHVILQRILRMASGVILDTEYEIVL